MTRTLAAGLSLAVTMLCGACKEKTSAPQATSASLSDAGRTRTPLPDVASAELPERELRALLDRWLAAQNDGDFPAYQQLYASKFYGVKRAGQREQHFQRASWLEDRKRMFGKPMTIAAAELVLRPSTSSAVLTFTQHFASGNFSDVGPKRLLVVREGETLKIAQEEMLSSRELSGKSALNKEFDLHFVLTTKRGLLMVLADDPMLAPKRPVQREQEEPAVGGLLSTSVPASDAELSAEMRSLRGQRVRLDDGCIAEVADFVHLSRVVPHFGTYAEWENRHGDLPHGALSAQQVNEAAFRLGDAVIAARLTGCRRGRYAQRESTPVPATAERPNEPTLIEQALAAFTKHPEVLAAQKELQAAAEGASGPWWQGNTKAEVYRHPLSRQTLVSVHAELPTDGCDGYGAAQWAVFEQRGKKLVLLSMVPEAPAIEQVLDVNGDGRLEFLHRGNDFGVDVELTSPDPEGPAHALVYRFMDCPC